MKVNFLKKAITLEEFVNLPKDSRKEIFNQKRDVIYQKLLDYFNGNEFSAEIALDNMAIGLNDAYFSDDYAEQIYIGLQEYGVQL